MGALYEYHHITCNQERFFIKWSIIEEGTKYKFKDLFVILKRWKRMKYIEYFQIFGEMYEEIVRKNGAVKLYFMLIYLAICS